MEIVVNYSSICRICLTDKDLKPFIEEQFLSTFKTITGIEVTAEDGLPQSICTFCIEQLTNIDSFIQQCKINDLSLRAAISSQICKSPAILRHNDYNDCSGQFEDCTASSLSDEMECLNDNNVVNSDNIIIECIDKKQNEDSDQTQKLSKHTPDEIKCANYKNGNSANTFECIDENQSEGCDQTQKLSTHQCHLCKSDFSCKFYLTKHYKDNIKCRPNTIKFFKCELCCKEFSQLELKKEHMNLHTGLTPYLCPYCGKRFHIRSTYLKHMRRHKARLGESAVGKYEEYKETNIKLKIKCKFCTDKSFSSKHGYSHHLLSKHNIGPGNQGGIGRNEEGRTKRFLCHYCAKSFHTYVILQDHLERHSDEKPYECEECHRHFKTRRNVGVHKYHAHQNREFKCGICDQTFTTKQGYTMHKRLHTGEKLYLCNICGKSFNYRNSWKVHLRIHTGEKPFICPVCFLQYYDKGSLRKHQKTKDHDILQ